MVLFGFALALLFLGGCAYPQKVKDATAEQVKLANQFRSTAVAFKQAADASLKRRKNLRTEKAQAKEAQKLFKKFKDDCLREGAPTECPKEDPLGKDFEAISSGKFPNLDKFQTLLDYHFEGLDLQLQVMGRGAAIIEQYVDIDLTLGKDQINDLKEAIMSLAEAEGSP